MAKGATGSKLGRCDYRGESLMTITPVCTKCGYNVFDRNEDGDDVCVRCGKVRYNSPISEPKKTRVDKNRKEIMAEAKIRHEKDNWGVKEFVAYMGVGKTTARRWLREWASG